MSDSRYEYDVDAVGFTNLKIFKKTNLDKRKKYLKTCVICGKEEKMAKNQVRCTECVTKDNLKGYRNSHCYICGRYGKVLLEIEGLKYCSFCLRNIKSKTASPTIKRKYCKICKKRIVESTFIKNNGLCKICFNIKKETLELKQILSGRVA